MTIGLPRLAWRPGPVRADPTDAWHGLKLFVEITVCWMQLRLLMSPCWVSQRNHAIVHIGIIVAGSAYPLEGFKLGLRDRGWLEGENIGFELRAAVGELRRLPKFANQIASAGVDAIAVTHVPREDIATKSTSIGQIMAAAAFSRISASSLGY